jgi:hypothetical protein
MNDAMDLRRASWAAAFGLAVTLSTVAAAVAVALNTVAGVSETALVLAVLLIGFSASWVLTGHIERTQRPAHRVAVVPLRRPAG